MNKPKQNARKRVNKEETVKITRDKDNNLYVDLGDYKPSFVNLNGKNIWEAGSIIQGSIIKEKFDSELGTKVFLVALFIGFMITYLTL